MDAGAALPSWIRNIEATSANPPRPLVRVVDAGRQRALDLSSSIAPWGAHA
jgi:hypothetical protein